MVRNCIIIAQRINGVPQPTNPPGSKFFASHSGSMSLIYLSNFYPERKNNMLWPYMIRNLCHSWRTSLLLFSITYLPQSQVSQVRTNSKMLSLIYCFCSRVNINFHWYYFNLLYFFITVSLRPSIRMQIPEWRQVWYFLESQNRRNSWCC